MNDKEIKILVVEDELTMSMLLTRLLKQLGYSVLPVVTTGEEAVAAAKSSVPDLILMDIYLEGEMTGIQAAELILAQQNIPVIYATADSDEKTIKNARSTYPLGYILKPYNVKVLKSTIEVALSIREVEARKNRELQLAYDTIHLQTKEILDSFKSAKGIQQAILPSEKAFLDQFPDSFILNIPKESLGGDFFWFKNLNNGNTLFSVIDCTGHGVPGALMSILVNYQLSKVLGQLQDGDALEYIFSSIDKFLSDGYEDASKEPATDEIRNLNAGFDAALGMLNKEKNILTYCGAKRPLVLVRNGELIEYKGNRASVGLFNIANKSFHSEEIHLQSGDLLYFFSDGFADQIGGEKHSRLKSGPFKKLLLSISDLPLVEQQKQLNQFFNSWKGSEEQMDDVMVLGLRV